MCGIYGKIRNSRSNDSSSQELELMMATSEYRGPDSHEVKIFDNVQLGFNRLAIIDLDPRSNQPFERKDLNKVIVFNGEIYNYIELKNDLIELGYTFSTNSDTEVFLVAYHHFKEEVFNKLNGMWACCIYDTKNCEILLSRDRFGVKPLYYMEQEGNFYFASEMKSLLAVRKNSIRNNNAIGSFLVFGKNKFSDGSTFVEEIFEHPAGSYSKLANGKLEHHSYYVIPEINRSADLEGVKKSLREFFRSSLKLRMRADVPVAILLSGGLDSSLIAFHLNDMIEKGEIEVKEVHAFTLHFTGYKDNEWELVQKNSKLLPHIVCHPIEINITEFKAELDNLISQQDIPTLSISHLIHVIAQQEIKNRGFKVLLNGQGPDEVYGGYFPPDFGYLFLDYILSNPRMALNEMKAVKRNWGYSQRQQCKLIVQAFIHTKLPGIYNSIKKRQCLEEIDGLKVDLKSEPIQPAVRRGFYNFRSKSQVFEKQFNGILNYEDMASMLNSLEMRSPFMDYRIVDLGLSLPCSFKLKQGNSKWILREVLGDIIPNEIRWSGWKLGYVVPKNELMKGLIPIGIELTEAKMSMHWRKHNLEKWLLNQNIQ
jgi:asparagine synthase (glutamine-hydrolysing)